MESTTGTARFGIESEDVMLEERIGYLVAKVEELGADQKAMQVKLESLQQRVDEKFAALEAVAKFGSVLVTVGIAVVTLPWSSFTAFLKRLVS